MHLHLPDQAKTAELPWRSTAQLIGKETACTLLSWSVAMRIITPCFSNLPEHMQAAGQVRGGGLPRSRESRPVCGFRCCAMRPIHCCPTPMPGSSAVTLESTSPSPGFSQPPCAINFIGHSGQLSEEDTRNGIMAVICVRPVCGNEDERASPCCSLLSALPWAMGGTWPLPAGDHLLENGPPPKHLVNFIHGFVFCCLLTWVFLLRRT